MARPRRQMRQSFNQPWDLLRNPEPFDAFDSPDRMVFGCPHCPAEFSGRERDAKAERDAHVRIEHPDEKEPRPDDMTEKDRARAQMHRPDPFASERW